jgi:hypothetical protein
MILSQIIYKSNNKNKPLLILILGKENDFIVCLNDKNINEQDTNLIKKNIQKLSKYTLHNKIRWIKENTPNTYKKAFRKLHQKNIKIIKSYSLLSNKFM